MKISIKNILNKKRLGQKITMLTAYDYPLAVLIDRAGINMILVGDSLANVVLGLDSTQKVGMAEMLHHAKAARRGVKRALLIADMPYRSYANEKLAVKNAKRFIREAGCDGVKLEWFDNCGKIAKAIVKSGIPVMGHVGLTPQTAKAFKVQGVTAEGAKRIAENAEVLEKAGCFSIVIECVPDKVAKLITKTLKIPTIGIGAGGDCDGQVLVIHDILGLTDGFHPRFIKQYVNSCNIILKAARRYRFDVVKKKFPSSKNIFHIKDDEFKKFQILLGLSRLNTIPVSLRAMNHHGSWGG